MLSKEQSLSFLGSLATATVTSVGLALGGPIGSTVLAGIGINLASDMINAGFLRLREKWLYSNDGLLNHDVQMALARAFEKSISVVGKHYLESDQAKGLKEYERQSIQDLFEELNENAHNRLLVSLDAVRDDVNVKSFLLNEANVDNAKVWERIVGDETLSRYGSDLRNFVHRNLLDQTLFWFGEELKTDRPDCNRAWRAFQRMIWEGIYAEVKGIQADQEKIIEYLKILEQLQTEFRNLGDQIERRLPDERFAKEVYAVTGQISMRLDELVKVNLRIDENVAEIRSDVKDLLQKYGKTPPENSALLTAEVARLRRDLLSADSTYELKAILYSIEELLSTNPKHHEARSLRDQVERALAFESRQMLMAEEIPLMCKAPPTRRWINIGLVILGLGFLILLVYLLTKSSG